MTNAHPCVRRTRWLLTPAFLLVLAASALATPTLEITPTRIEPGEIGVEWIDA